MQPIAIRLERQLIRELKFIARIRGIGYQPLMRQVLAAEIRQALHRIADSAPRETSDG